MLSTVKNLGDYVSKKDGLSTESMFMQSSKIEDVKNVLCINFESKKDSIAYKNVFISRYNPSDYARYLYRIHPHQRYDVTPTSRMGNPEKTRKRFELWFETISGEYLKDPLLYHLRKEFLDKISHIFDDVTDKYKNIDQESRRNTIITITIEEGIVKYLGDYDIFRRILKDEASRGFHFKHDVEARGEGMCFLCKRKREVFGFGSPFSFYTFDKRGFAPNFLREDAWKSLPLCISCCVALSAGKNFINKYLNRRFYGFNFFILPSFILGFNDEIIEEIRSPKKNYSTLLCREDNISEIIAESNSLVNLTFVFIKPKQSDYFDIMRYIEYVPPSWIKRISEERKSVLAGSIFGESFLKQVFGKKWVGTFDDKSDATLGGLVRDFFPRSKIEGIYDKYFLDIIGDMLAQRRIRLSLLMDAFSEAIRNAFRKNTRTDDWKMRILALKSLGLVLLLRRLKIVELGEGILSSDLTESGKELFTPFFKEYGDAFGTPDKRAAFLEGVLAKYLMDVQYADRESTPFREKLYGLRLDERRIKKLFPEILEKLREYKVTYTALEQEAARAFVEAGKYGWKLSNGETSYFFALGMTLAPVFKMKNARDDEE